MARLVMLPKYTATELNLKCFKDFGGKYQMGGVKKNQEIMTFTL